MSEQINDAYELGYVPSPARLKAAIARLKACRDTIDAMAVAAETADAALARKDALLKDIRAELNSGVMFQQKRNGEATGRASEIVRALAARIEAEIGE